MVPVAMVVTVVLAIATAEAPSLAVVSFQRELLA